MIRRLELLLALSIALGIGSSATVANTTTAHTVSRGDQRLTILVDAFGSQPQLHQDWGYAALIEYGGKRILFDTGNDGFFRAPEPLLPVTMRYFNGAIPDVIPHGSAWTGANFIRVTNAVEIAPGFRLVRNISSTQQFSETPELSLVIDTPKRQIIVVGCSHPGIERIVASVAARDPHIAMVVGGLHLVTAAKPEIERLAAALHDEWKIDRIAPGHCTGELTFAVLQRIFGDQYQYVGVGSVLYLP